MKSDKDLEKIKKDTPKVISANDLVRLDQDDEYRYIYNRRNYQKGKLW
jgi:hypothetical protein